MCGIKCEAFFADLHLACDTGKGGHVKKKDTAEGRFLPLIRSILFSILLFSRFFLSLFQRLCHDPPGHVEGLFEYGQI